MVVSGINFGANMGDDTIYSGTVAAATEGYLFGIPSIAVSLASKAGAHFETAARGRGAKWSSASARAPIGAAGAAQRQRARHRRSASSAARGDAPGPAPQGRAGGEDADPRGETVYWIGAAGGAQDAGPGTDFHAVAARPRLGDAAADRSHLHRRSCRWCAEWLRTDERAAPGAQPRRHRHDLAAHARAHGRAAARAGHRRRARARGDGRACRGTCSSRRRSPAAPTRTPRCRSASARPFRSPTSSRA